MTMTLAQRFVIMAVACVACVAWLAPPASAKEVVGTGEVGGRAVELLDDRSWRYSIPLVGRSSDRCDVIKTYVEFCNSLNWDVSEPVGHAAAVYAVNDRTYVMLVIEHLGRADGVTPDYMVEAAHWYAAEGFNIQQDSLDVHYTRATRARGHDYTTTSYSGKVKGLAFTFVNNIYIGEKFTVQAFAYMVGAPSPKLEATSAEVLERLSFLE